MCASAAASIAVSVIEIGCGTGAVLRRLHAANFARKYFCTDLSSSAIAYVRASCPAFAASAMVGQAEALAYPDGAFDLAILSHVIEHMQTARRFAGGVPRSALCCHRGPDRKGSGQYDQNKTLPQPYPSIAAAGHVQFWSALSIAAFLKGEAGLEILARHQDLLDEEAGSARFHPDRARQALKRSLRTFCPLAVRAAFYHSCGVPMRQAGLCCGTAAIRAKYFVDVGGLIEKRVLRRRAKNGRTKNPAKKEATQRKTNQ